MRPGKRRVLDAPAPVTFTDNLRRMTRWPLLLKVLLVVVPLAAFCVAVVPEPFTTGPAFLVGIPLLSWLLRRDQSRRIADSENEVQRDGGR
jgi:hypothetical protein